MHGWRKIVFMKPRLCFFSQNTLDYLNSLKFIAIVGFLAITSQILEI